MLLGALQSSYLPWLGYFDQINRCDLFIVYDDLQYTRKDWRNRNRIKTPEGTRWLSVPVQVRGGCLPSINEVPIDNSQPWARRHWQSICHSYRRALYFSALAPRFEALYAKRWKFLADLNRALLLCVLDLLGISTPIVFSSQQQLERDFEHAYGSDRDATDRILFITARYGADRFLEGASGRNYIQHRKIAEAPFELLYHDYRHPVYPQRFGPFVSHLSVIDLLFNVGPESLTILSNQHHHVRRKEP